MDIGIQVSSLKPLLLTEEQVFSACRKMKAMGVHTLQLQWIDPSVPIEAIARALEENGLHSVSVQDPSTAMIENSSYYTALNAATGGSWICASRIPENRKSPAGLDLFARELEELGKKLEKLGQKLCFHPISSDYTALPDRNAVEYLLEALPELQLCLDLYHLNRNCEDMPGFLRRYAGRVCMVHFKDSRDGVLVPSGQGDTNWDGVVAACLETRVPYAFVEQETWDRDPYDCLKEAMDFVAEEMRNAQISTGYFETNVL